MNWIHVHLLLNHIPILGVAFGLGALSAALIVRSKDLRDASLVTFVVTGSVAGLTYFTGEEAEELTNGLPGFVEATVLRHDDAAWYAMMAAIVLGVVALAGLWRFRGSTPLPRWMTATTLALAILTTGFMVWTGWLGGQIRHPEASAVPTISAKGQSPGSADHWEGILWWRWVETSWNGTSGQVASVASAAPAAPSSR